VQADFAVELGRDDEVLEFPWAADGGPRYFDLKRHPELLPNIDEASRVPELGEFLTAINSLPLLETAKCDIWPSTDINPEEEIFGATHKFGSYIDLVFSSDSARFSFPEHEQFVKHLTQLLAQVPEIPASAEFMIRRAYYTQAETRDGFYITFYLFGYGNEESQSRKQWTIALKLIENAIRQIAKNTNL